MLIIDFLCTYQKNVPSLKISFKKLFTKCVNHLLICGIRMPINVTACRLQSQWNSLPAELTHHSPHLFPNNLMSHIDINFPPRLAYIVPRNTPLYVAAAAAALLTTCIPTGPMVKDYISSMSLISSDGYVRY